MHLPDKAKKFTLAMHSHKIATPTGTPVPDEKVKELSSIGTSAKPHISLENHVKLADQKGNPTELYIARPYVPLSDTAYEHFVSYFVAFTPRDNAARAI